MADSLDDIDTSPVGELASVKQERDRLEGYRSRADLMKDQVDVVVYRRVLEDYGAKHAELDRISAPLTALARTQYQALLVLERRVRTGFEEARLAKEELEFRHAVGELTEAQLADKVQEPQQTLAERQADLDAIARIKAQFLDVVPSEDVLALASVESTTMVPATAPPITTSAATPPLSGADTRQLLVPPGAGRSEPTPPQPAEDAEESSQSPEPDGRGDQTFLVPEASLEPIDDSTDGAHFRLGVVTSIGRSADNHIRLVKAGVSRRHAVIRLTERGFALEDLGSQNGTFINGARAPHHDLADGDVIWIGDVKVVFKSKWAPPGADAAAGGRSGSAIHQARRSRRA